MSPHVDNVPGGKDKGKRDARNIRHDKTRRQIGVDEPPHISSWKEKSRSPGKIFFFSEKRGRVDVDLSEGSLAEEKEAE